MHLHLFRARKALPTSDGFAMDGEKDGFRRSKPSEKKDINLAQQKGDEARGGPIRTNAGASKMGNSPESGRGGETGGAARMTWGRIGDRGQRSCSLLAEEFRYLKSNS